MFFLFFNSYEDLTKQEHLLQLKLSFTFVAMKPWLFLLVLGTFCFARCGVRKEVYEARKREAERKIHPEVQPKPKYIYGENIPDQPKSQTLIPTRFEQPLPINRKKFVQQAFKYQGVPYKYGGTDPSTGFDCSGFVYRVFNDFGYKPPRVSADYTHLGKEVRLKKAEPGDIILFSSPGTKKSKGVGHMGIIVETNPEIKFIHSATSKSRGVMVSKLEGYYMEHFVKIIRVLK